MSARPPRARRGLVAAALATALAGCTTLTSSEGAPLAPLPADFRPGESTRGELLALLGPPTRLTACGDGVALLYESLATEEVQFGLGLELIDLNLLKLSLGQGSARRRVLLVLLDGAGRLQLARFWKWTEDLGSGGSLQIAFTVGSVVDTRFLDEATDLQAWGMGMLEDLPATLNAHASPDTGRAGLDQRGTPDGVGQRTLELRPRD